MSTNEAGSKIGDTPPVAELVECQPDVQVETLSVDVSAVQDATPVQQAMAATIAQTGADPPPSEGR